MKPVIVLAAHTMGYGIIRSLGHHNIPIISAYYGKEDFGHLSKYINKAVRIPNPGDNPDDFLNSLIELSKEFGGGLLIPSNDDTLEVVSKNKTLLSEYYTVATNDWDITEKVLNKKLTYEIAASLNIDMPKTIFPSSSEEIKTFFTNLNSTVIVKPCVSHTFYNTFSKKFFRFENIKDLNNKIEDLTESNFNVMVQELIKSKDSDMVMYNAYSINGKPVVEMTAQKMRNGPAVYGNSTVSKSKKIEEIILPSRKILQHLEFTGYCCIEFRKDLKENKYKFLEINGRYNLSNYLFNGCGINVPLLEYQYYILGKEPLNSLNFKEGIYWIDFFRDFSYSIPRVFKREIMFSELIKPYFSKHVFAILDFSDLKPFLQRGFKIFKNPSNNLKKSSAYKKKENNF